MSAFRAVAFKDLYNLRAPVGTVEGFDISAFDKRVRRHYTCTCIMLYIILSVVTLACGYVAVCALCSVSFRKICRGAKVGQFNLRGGGGGGQRLVTTRAITAF